MVDVYASKFAEDGLVNFQVEACVRARKDRKAEYTSVSLT